MPWRLDGLPLLLDPADWNVLEVGLTQRATLLDAVLSDLYGAQELISSGALPPQLLFAHPGYVRAAHGMALPGTSCFCSAAISAAPPPATFV